MKHAFSFYLILLLSAVGILPTAAQQHFNKRYTLHSAASIISGVVEKNHKYYTTAISLDSSNYDIVSGGFFNKWGIRFSSYDSLGNIIRDTVYQRIDRRLIDSWSNNLRILPNGNFLMAANAVDTASIYGQFIAYTCLLQFDSIGNLLSYKEYTRPSCSIYEATYNILYDFKPDAFGNWLMLSSVICNGPVQFCLRKLDSNFNELWVKRFSTSVMNHIPAHLLIEPDGYVMTGGIDNGNMKLHTDYYASVLIKCDTSGNPLWTWQNTFDTTQLQYTIKDILHSKDGGYVYCGSGQGEPAYFSGKWDWSNIYTLGWVEKLDIARKSVWKRAIGTVKSTPNTTQQSVLKELDNGDIMVAGNIVKNVSPTLAYTFASLTKLKGTDGSIIWQRTYQYQPDTLSGFINDMRQTEDGGFILAGECKDDVVYPFDAPTQRGWLIKVDSNGCETSGIPCNPSKIPIITGTKASIAIYPNPCSNYYEVEYNNEDHSPAIISITDLSGRVIAQYPLPQGKSRIEAEAWASGLYFYTVLQHNNSLSNGKLVKY